MEELEWLSCRSCGQDHTWFRIEVIEDVELYGWVHRISEGCERDEGMVMIDKRQYS